MDFTKETFLRFCDCDYQKRAKLSTILANIADIAGLAYADKGYSHTWLWQNDFVFLLSRISAHFVRMPKADETISVKTWERDVQGVSFLRDFIITDEKNLTVIEASTAWALVSPTTRQILRPKAFTGKMDLNPQIKANVNPLGRLKFDGDMNYLGEREIVYSDIDANGHLYNAVYADIAYDFLPEILISKELKDFSINFKQEALIHDKLNIYANITENFAFVIGKIGDIISFECQLDFY